MDYARVRFEKRRDRDGRVILQSLSDTRQRRPNLDAVLPKMRGRPNPGPHQVRRRMDGAAG